MKNNTLLMSTSQPSFIIGGVGSGKENWNGDNLLIRNSIFRNSKQVAFGGSMLNGNTMNARSQSPIDFGG